MQLRTKPGGPAKDGAGNKNKAVAIPDPCPAEFPSSYVISRVNGVGNYAEKRKIELAGKSWDIVDFFVERNDYVGKSDFWVAFNNSYDTDHGKETALNEAYKNKLKQITGLGSSKIQGKLGERKPVERGKLGDAKIKTELIKGLNQEFPGAISCSYKIMAISPITKGKSKRIGSVGISRIAPEKFQPKSGPINNVKSGKDGSDSKAKKEKHNE
ncbi:hypothetical protein [Candidatus Hydrogenosomobacter endosymbioticus]|nr:hypothetical protein [Candidatus Hydrogenosomobacter endosymbioticus]